MANVLNFPARPLSGRVTPEMRASLEHAAQTLLDGADQIIRMIDALDGDAEAEDGGDAEPSLGAPEGCGSQVIWLRGNDQDREEDRQPCV